MHFPNVFYTVLFTGIGFAALYLLVRLLSIGAARSWFETKELMRRKKYGQNRCKNDTPRGDAKTP